MREKQYRLRDGLLMAAIVLLVIGAYALALWWWFQGIA